MKQPHILAILTKLKNSKLKNKGPLLLEGAVAAGDWGRNPPPPGIKLHA